MAVPPSNFLTSFTYTGPLVDVTEEMRLPKTCRVLYSEIGDDAPAVYLTLRLDGNVLVVTSFEVVPAGGGHLTAADFRKVRYQEIVDRVLGAAALGGQSEAAGRSSAVGGDLQALAASVSRTRRPMTEALLTEVAAVANANPKQPTKQVAAQLFTSHRNATRWIAEAKRQGYLKEGDRS